jgi:hypothetical protein
MPDRFRLHSARALTGTCLLALALVTCNDGGTNFDVSSQIGPDPVLPEPRAFSIYANS